MVQASGSMIFLFMDAFTVSQNRSYAYVRARIHVRTIMYTLEDSRFTIRSGILGRLNDIGVLAGWFSHQQYVLIIIFIFEPVIDSLPEKTLRDASL